MTREEAAARLTARQLECLRLVYDRLGSKEIARELGISPHTVDEHLKTALRALGLASRVQAARLIFDVHDTPRSLVNPELRGADQGKSDVYALAPDSGVTDGGAQDQLSVAEEVVPFGAPSDATRHDASWVRLFNRRVRNDLTMFQRIAYVLVLVIGLAVASGFAAVSLVGLAAVGRAVWFGSIDKISL